MHIERPDPERPLGLGRLLRFPVQAHPSFGMADLYKLLHQACLGPEHLGRNADSLRWLLGEWEEVQPSEGLLLEPIDPKGRMVRVSLDSLKTHRGSVLTLWRVMLATPRETPEGRARLARYLRASVALAKRGAIHVDPKHLAEIARKAESQGYPPGRHSKAYLAAERPSYRVAPFPLLSEHWDELFPSPRA